MAFRLLPLIADAGDIPLSGGVDSAVGQIESPVSGSW
jgi:hypothetical protein